MIIDRYLWLAFALCMAAIVVPVMVFSPAYIFCLLWGGICGWFGPELANILRYYFSKD